MQERAFNEIFDKQLISRSTVLLDEDITQSCDFFILELVRELQYSVFQWNDSGEFLRRAYGKYNVQPRVSSAYTADYGSEDILDDVYVQRRLGHSARGKVGVFRSSTATARDYYDYDVVVKIDRLSSGFTAKMDGCIRMFSRDRVYCDMKYKVYPDRIAYFD